MRNTSIFIALLCLSIACKEGSSAEPESVEDGQSTDTTARVTGIGGIFFLTNDPERTKEWYATNLGIETVPYGAVFESRNSEDPEELNYLTWSPHDSSSKYFEPSKSRWMINYRVQNIEALVRQLNENGVTVLDEIEVYDYGKFVHILDMDSNKIELWEPVDSVLTTMGGPTNK